MLHLVSLVSLFIAVKDSIPQCQERRGRGVDESYYEERTGHTGFSTSREKGV